MISLMHYCFRPLDGESFSKQDLLTTQKMMGMDARFRPLDGESFSKLVEYIKYHEGSECRFPSPRRGIIF